MKKMMNENTRLAFELFKTMAFVILIVSTVIGLPIRFLTDWEFGQVMIIFIPIAIGIGLFFYWRFTVLCGSKKALNFFQMKDLINGRNKK